MSKEKDTATKVGPTRTNRACLHCRRQKMRCEGADDPPCKRCRNSLVECVFERRTDYLLNPEDKAWQIRMEEKVNNLTSSVEELFQLLHLVRQTPFPTTLPNQPLTPFQSHNHPHQPWSNPGELYEPIIETPSAFVASGIHSRQPSCLASSSESAQLQHRQLQEGHTQYQLEPLHPAEDGEIDHETNSDNSRTPTHPFLSQYTSQVINQDQAQEIFGFVRERYQVQLPIFKLMPDPSLSPKELANWAKTLHPFVSSVILAHGSSHHPSPRSAALFRPLLKESEDRFKGLIREIGASERPDPLPVLWADVTSPIGYKIVLTMCIATIYLAAPNPPYRFLGPSHILYLLRCPSLYNAYGDLFGANATLSTHQTFTKDPNEPTALSRYTLYIWLYMIFCHFSSPDLILPEDISDVPSITDIRRLLSLSKGSNSDPDMLQMLCAHSELIGLRQWSRKKWMCEALWSPSELTNNALLDFHTAGESSWAVWSSRFEETRTRLNEWDHTWYPTLAYHHSLSYPDAHLPVSGVPPIRGGPESFGYGYLSRMLWMHYEAKQAANYASALFRLPSDPTSWPFSENLYGVALEGVRQSCFLLQCFIGEEPIRDSIYFPISHPSVAPWQTAQEASSSKKTPAIIKRAPKRIRSDVGESAKRISSIDLRDYLATCPVSIQRYPIPFAGVILKAIHLKHALGLAGAEVMINGARHNVFEELQIEAAFDLLERVIHVCAVAGLDGNHPVSPTAFELAKMVSIARRFVAGMRTTTPPVGSAGGVQA